MDTKPLFDDRFIDEQALKIQLSALIRKNGSADSSDQKTDVLNLFKTTKAHIFEAVEKELKENGKGLICTQYLAGAMDRLINVIYSYAIHYVYPNLNQAEDEKISIVAVGGYGRATLAPHSDIDLLFILPYKQTASSESIIEYILYMLWDLGYKVGHSTRTVDDCLKYAKEDMTIRTALLESRFIVGNKNIYESFKEKFNQDIILKRSREFVTAKFEERNNRHEKLGNSRYLVEPNIKESKGGLRDLHVLFWIAKSAYQVSSYKELYKLGLLTRKEINTFKRCENFLWTMRCHLHFITNRPEEKLTFDLQMEITKRLGYNDDDDGMRNVERFMRHYFLIARDVGNLTAIICTGLEIHKFKKVQFFSRFVQGIKKRSTAINNYPQFKNESGRLSVAHEDIFKEDPINLIRIFNAAEETDLQFHPDATRLISNSLSLINSKVRKDPEANRLFLHLLTSYNGSEEILRIMNNTGLLGRFIPEFGKIVSMMQFNMYHHYTVDEHLLRTVGILQEIEKGNLGEEHPLAHELIKSIRHRRALYVAAFIHDIAKGRPEDHSIEGAKIAKKLCPRLGLSPVETDLVSWLIHDHLTMSIMAQSRDVTDPKTIKDFVGVVQTLDRMRHLLILTVCDIKAVGPGVWNGWKGELLRNLFSASEPHLSSGYSEANHQTQVNQNLQKFKHQMQDIKSEQLDALIERHYASYWLKVDLDSQIRHSKMIMEDTGHKLENIKFDIQADSFKAITEITIYTPDHANLLCYIAKACAQANANILDAQIFTTKDGFAIDTILLKQEFNTDEDEERRAISIIKTLSKLLKGDLIEETGIHKIDPLAKRKRAFNVEEIVTLSNDLSNNFTVIECEAIDRAALLFKITAAIKELNLNISSAHITTFGEKAVDCFYVTDYTGDKITCHKRQEKIINHIKAIL